MSKEGTTAHPAEHLLRQSSTTSLQDSVGGSESGAGAKSMTRRTALSRARISSLVYKLSGTGSPVSLPELIDRYESTSFRGRHKER